MLVLRMVLEPLISPALHLFFAVPVALLQPALKLIVTSFDLEQIIIGELAPLSFEFSFELLPLSFELFAIYWRPSCDW